MTYTAPAFLLTIFQVFLAIIIASVGPVAKMYWAKAHMSDDYDMYMARFRKSIYAIIAILCLEAITAFVKYKFQ